MNACLIEKVERQNTTAAERASQERWVALPVSVAWTSSDVSGKWSRKMRKRLLLLPLGRLAARLRRN